MEEYKRETRPSPPEAELWRLTPSAVEKVLNSLGVYPTPCQQCGSYDSVMIDCPDKLEGTIPRIASFGLTNDGHVDTSKGFFMPVVNLACGRCGYNRTFIAYSLLLQLNRLEGRDNV